MWPALFACTTDPGRPDLDPLFPAPDAYAGPSGPGGPARSFADAELMQPCGYVIGGPGDAEHHNLAVIHDGYLVHPWAPEDGGGGISFLDVSDPCAPAVVGQAWADGMRETHALAFGEADGREYLAVDWLHPDDHSVGGVGFFDVTDPADPRWVSELATPDFYYPDAYFFVTLGSTWVGPYLYVAAAFNGVHVVDVSDPLDPSIAHTITFEPPHLVGSVHVIGNLAVVASAGTPRVVLLDVSDPLDPRPIPGGDFFATDAQGDVENYYFSSVGGRYLLLARNDAGGGPILYDLTDPGAPRWVGQAITEDGDGGYAYRQGDHLFQGDSSFALFYDLTDPASPVETGRYFMQGDVDTTSPIGNVVLVSVDADSEPGRATHVVPHQAEPDLDPPAVELTSPPDGAENQAVTSRIGVVFDEWVERATVFEGSFRVADVWGHVVEGTFNVQEATVNFTPDQPLEPGTTYLVSLPAGGVTDVSGNPVAEDTTWSFSTAP